MRREFTSDEFRATLKDGLLAVYSLRERQLVETKIEGGKASQRTVGPSSDDPLGRLAAEMSKWPVFAATAAEDDEGWFHLDIDAGFQRWIGMKPEEDVRDALSRCGFDEGDIDTMVAACQAEPWSYLPRQCP